MKAKGIWLVPVKGEEMPRAVKAHTAKGARRHVAEQVVGEPRKATSEDGFRLAEEGVKVEEVAEE